MKPVDGLDLTKVVSDAEADVAAEHREVIFKQVRSIMVDLRNWKAQLEKDEKALAKLKAKIELAEKKLTSLKAGEWGALAEQAAQSEPEKPG